MNPLRKSIVVVSCFAFGSFHVDAQTENTAREIVVKIIDSETKKPVKAAKAFIPGTTREATTNVMGYFQLSIDTAKLVIVESDGYQTSQINIPDIDKFQVELKRNSEIAGPKRVYLDEYGFDAEQNNAKYYRVVKDNPSGSSKIAEEYTLNGAIKETWSFKHFDIFTKNGLVTSYYFNGKKKEEGVCNDDSRMGKWKSWYFNGQIKEECQYFKSKNRSDRYKIENYWDSLGNQLVSQGNGEQVISSNEEVILEKGQVKNGVRSGVWTGWFAGGKVAFEEKYESGRLVKGHSYDETGEEFKYDEEDNYFLSFYEFVMRSIKYPANARRYDIQGTVMVKILIDPNGQILKSSVLKGIGGGCDEEVVRVINNSSGKWNWGTKRGQPYKPKKPQSYIMPIIFKLG